MKKLGLLVVLLAVFMAGCAGLGAPAQHVPGFLFSDTKTPAWDLNVNTNGDSTTKIGRAMCQSVLGLIATGDCSIDAAKKNGGIIRVTSVDFEVKNFLGVYTEYTTKVSGQ